MELRDIEYFGVIAEHLHLGRAAGALGLTQPALSKSLRRLETHLGAKLVKRTAMGVRLTEEGAALASRAHALRLSLEDAVREVRDVIRGRVGHLRIGAAPGIAECVLPSPCGAMLRDAPRLTFDVTIGHNDVLLRTLRNGEVDLLIAGVPDISFEDLVQERLYDDEFVVCVRPSHPLSGRRSISLKDVSDGRWVTGASDVMAWQQVQRVMQDHALPAPGIAFQASSHELRAMIAASSDLLCFTARRAMNQSAAGRSLVVLPIRELHWIRHVGLSYRKSAYLSPFARQFIEAIKVRGAELANDSARD